MCKAKCVICGLKPAQTERGYCHNCEQKLAAERAKRNNGKCQSQLQRDRTIPTYMTYQGAVVKLTPHLTDNGTSYRPTLVRSAAEKLPKSKTLNLNEWCEGYAREQIKRFKATILALAG